LEVALSATDGVGKLALSFSFWRRLSGVGVLEFSTGLAVVVPFFLSLLIGVLSEEKSVSLSTSGSAGLGLVEIPLPGIMIGTLDRTGLETELGFGTTAFDGKGIVVLLRLLEEVLEVEICGTGVLEDSRGRPSACNVFELYFLPLGGMIVDSLVTLDLLR
jgi:hypothetical protein